MEVFTWYLPNWRRQKPFLTFGSWPSTAHEAEVGLWAGLTLPASSRCSPWGPIYSAPSQSESQQPFCSNWQTVKFIWKYQGPRIVKTALKKKSKVGHDLAYDEATVIKTERYWCQESQLNQYNKIENIEIELWLSGPLTFYNGTRAVQGKMGKWVDFSTNGAKTIEYLKAKKLFSFIFLTIY